MRRLQQWFIGWLCLGLAVCLPATAQTKLDNAQLDQLMAPVALYPDSLLSQILMGATYPDDVAAAAKWSAAHTSESGDQAVKAVEGESWDPSVKSLVAFPSVMDMMGRQPDWVKSVGDAFLAQPDAVMDSVQRLRVQAQKAGNLKSTPQQKVTSSTTNDKTVVVIEPADPQVVYVPSYNPTVVYGTWAYPSYPPYYYPPPPGSVFATSLVAGIGFGLGVAAVNSMWGGFDWGHNDVDIDVNRYNNINVNQRIDRNNINNNRTTWQHNPANRGNTPYADQASRQRFDSQRQAGVQNRAQSFEGRTGQSIPGHSEPGAGRGQGAGRGDAAANRGQGQGQRAGQGGQGGQGARDRAQGGGQAQHSRPASSVSTQDRQAAAQRQRADEAAARDRGRASNSANALSGAGNGDQMRQQHTRSEMSRGGGGGPRGGGHGGGGRGGGGGGHFGGRR